MPKDPLLDTNNSAKDLPEEFGPYRIAKRLGQGGMGTVYLATDTRLNRRVALKVCHLESTQALERFRREAQAAAALRHPNLCPIYDCDVRDGLPYFTMAFIEGPTLDKWLSKRGGVTQREAVALIRKLALAMEAAHKAGVIHRDLKPANVVLDKGGEPIILDFGLARQGSGKEQRLTQAGAILGTPSYMAPEQVSGEVEAMGPASDIYSLGVMLYEMLTGELPFKGDVVALLGQILFNAPKPLRVVCPAVDEELEEICLRALAKKPMDRWPSMGEFASALTEWAKGGKTISSPASARPQRPKTIPGDAPWSRSYEGAKDEQPATFLQGADKPKKKFGRKKREKGNRALLFGSGLAMGLAALVMIGWLAFRQSSEVRKAVAENSEPGPKEATPNPGAKNPAPQQFRLEDLPKEVTNKIDMTFVLVLPGKFTMGSGPAEKGRLPDEGPQHEVTLDKPFYLGKYEVTRGQFRRFVQENKYQTEAERSSMGSWGWDGTKKSFERVVTFNWLNPGFEQADDHPAVCVSWNDAASFCAWLSRIEGKRYSLPTEAEWEYVCRAGSATAYCNGDDPALLVKVANVADASFRKFGPADLQPIAGDDGYAFTAPVGKFSANAWGLHDMHGNAYEWCADLYGAESYRLGNQTNPPGALTGDRRVIRGGSWFEASRCRSAQRACDSPSNHNAFLGFRVLLRVDQR